MKHSVTAKMSYTKYRDNGEINHILALVKEMWEANNHLTLGRLLHTISRHKGVQLKHLSDQQLQGYIIDALNGKFDKN
tara:strand:+ start:524 stop:757 length:234 start_codon:yes stop_codon:yes gene_type:complete